MDIKSLRYQLVIWAFALNFYVIYLLNRLEHSKLKDRTPSEAATENS